MSSQCIQEILSLVEKPSSYLGSETNAVCKKWESARLSVALAFPDLYEIGTSHFGIQILYHLLNGHPEILAERVFAPGVDMEKLLRDNGKGLSSLENGRPLKDFDIVGFSILYELNYTNILTMLELSEIPFLAADRNHSHPMIIAGGPCACNPEPVADFFDAILVGDGEDAIMEMAEFHMEWKNSFRPDKTHLLQQWAGIQGVYIPSFFQASSNEAGLQTVTPVYPDYSRVRRAIVGNLDKAAFPTLPVVPFGKPVHDRLRIEISRGCTRGCRFCQAGMIYRPVRERSVDTLLLIAEQSLEATGYDDVSLLSLSTGDYGCIGSLLELLMHRCQPQNIAVSLPSLRAGTLTPELMNQIKRVRKTGFTIAPEAGTQRLRNVINKNISEKDILSTVEAAYGLGWKVIKLYFMIGLPTETQADIDGIADLVEKIRRAPFARHKGTRLNVSLATFVPKAHTPFQWVPQISLEESREKINYLKQRLKMPGVHVKWQSPEVSYLEGVWARGDRKLSSLLIKAYFNGCRFDGWSDKFRFDLWQESMREEGIDADRLIRFPKGFDEPLPWDHIHTGVNRQFLIDEWHRAENESTIEDCREGACNDCGVCDFKKIQPVTFSANDIKTPPGFPVNENGGEFIKYEILYSKTGSGRFLGHLEMAKLFAQAIRRSILPIAFSQGFHPLPKISFEDPLPTGMESECERVFISLKRPVEPGHIVTLLSRHLTGGISVFGCRQVLGKTKNNGKKTEQYQIITTQKIDPAKLTFFTDADTFPVERTNHKGRKSTIDLKRHVTDIDLQSGVKLRMTIQSEAGKSMRPKEFLFSVLNLSKEEILLARVLKRKPKRRVLENDKRT